MFTAFIVLFRSLTATKAIVMIAVVPIRMSNRFSGTNVAELSTFSKL